MEHFECMQSLDLRYAMSMRKAKHCCLSSTATAHAVILYQKFQGVNILWFAKICTFVDKLKLPAMPCICYELEVSQKKIFMAMLRLAKIFNLESIILGYTV